MQIPILRKKKWWKWVYWRSDEKQ